MSYDPALRRDTPLARKLIARIRDRGPISVRDYMQACLYDQEYGYYRTQPAIGAAADFITAPEISQIFGELIGLWSAVVWQQMGSPERIHLVELGPGRGTLMRDALRAVRTVPRFAAAVSVLLIEPNETLRARQVELLRDETVPIAHLTPPDDPPAPAIFIANEIIDCLPIWQMVRATDPAGRPDWRQRVVGLETSGRLTFQIGPSARLMPGAETMLPAAQDGDILEDRNCGDVIGGLRRTAQAGPIAALLIDYGHTAHGVGDTLQAVRKHAFEHPLTSPGEADLTAHVDFAAMAAQLTALPLGETGSALAVDGPILQAQFLGRLGIVERAARLMAANPVQAGKIEAGAARLIAVPGMGDRFKAIGIRSSSVPPLPGFQ